MKPKFSIITAARNAGDLVDRTIESIKSQTYKNFEWIIIDGASTDGSLQKFERVSEMIATLVSEPDKGIADAWNKGLARATGDHILILNAGDTYDPSFLEITAQHCDFQRIICSHARKISEDGKEVGIFYARPRKLYRAMHLPHNWCAVPRQHYEGLGLYPNVPLAMDFEWFHRYYKRFGAGGFRIIDQVLGSYYLGGKSDVKFVESFKANEHILIKNGASPLLAQFYRLSYTLKHAIKCRVLRSS